MIALDIHQLTVQKQQRTIIQPINAQFHAGELTVLLGPNGAGKSTLLKAISGDETAQGKITYFGQPQETWARKDLAKHLGVLLQHSELSFNFSVEEVIGLGCLPLCANKATQQEWIHQAMTQTGLTHLAKRPYPLLSGGEKQRTHLARVLVQISQSGDQRILLLDEPTSALDLAHQHNTLKLAKHLAEQGACVIVVLHDINLAAQYADRILLLENGVLKGDGTPWETLTTNVIEKLYQIECFIQKHPEKSHPVIITQ